MRVENIHVKFNKDTIFHLVDCYPDSHIYPVVEEEYEEMIDMAYKKIVPKAVMEFSELPISLATDKLKAGTKVLYVITTIGEKMSEWSTKLFEEGNYLAGMLANAMGDDYLMQATESLKSHIIKLCKDKNLGIRKRLEAPTGISMEAQKVAWEVTNALYEIGLNIKESYMFDPVKSNCQIYLLEEGCTEYHVEHNCRECSAINCKLRKVIPINITLVEENKETVISLKENQSILEALRENDRYIPAICSGRGTCGKCRIKIIKGKVVPSKEDEKFFSLEELKEGYRLSCTSYPVEDVILSLEKGRDSEFYVVVDSDSDEDKNMIKNNEIGGDFTYAIGIDIGTTTIAMKLVEITSGTVIDNYATINRQRAYGADVISRIQVSNEGKGKELKECIHRDLKESIVKLLENRDKIKIERILIAGNTTMIHLLMAYSCETLGVFPFTPYYIGTIDTNTEELFGSLQGSRIPRVPVTILPGISTYVGGDIVSDLLYCKFYDKEEVCMIIDLGTNGEMAIGNREKILVASTAAGPAFEAGNIAFGTGSIPGAICGVSIDNSDTKVKTIGEKTACGICGTGVIEGVYELLKQELIDDTGLMVETYFDDGYPLAKTEDGRIIRLYQKDIREIQLAKAAVRAGTETLLLRYGIKAEELETVYLAGGFGYKIDVKKAIGIGLFPKVFEDKIKTIGNGSLEGTISYIEKKSKEKVENIRTVSLEINLSKDKDFNQIYMDSMYFKE